MFCKSIDKGIVQLDSLHITYFPVYSHSTDLGVIITDDMLHAIVAKLIEQGLMSPPTQYKLSGRQLYKSKDPTNCIKVLKENQEKANNIIYSNTIKS